MTDMQDAMRLITRHTEEVLTEKDLVRYLEAGFPLRHYIGLEISGQIHLGTGLMCMGKVKDFQDAGVQCSVFLADWHSWINDKLGGDREVIKRIAVGYFKEGLAASLKCLGGDPARVDWVLGSELYHDNDDYWATLIDVCKNTSLSRIQRSITIMGRSEGGEVDFAKLIYPPMQVADIYIQGLHIAHAGMDQRKAHVIARDVAHKLTHRPLKDPSGKTIKPIAIHHPLILGLGKPPQWPVPPESLKEVLAAMKMSKSKPDTAVFITDEPDDIRRKMKKAFCAEGDTSFNPVLDWAEKLLFRNPDFVLRIERPEKWGGNLEFSSYPELEKVFMEKGLHPGDLKTAVSEALVELLSPVREHFAQPEAKALLEEMQSLDVTR